MSSPARPLIVASNRGPVTFERGGRRGARRAGAPAASSRGCSARCRRPAGCGSPPRCPTATGEMAARSDGGRIDMRSFGASTGCAISTAAGRLRRLLQPDLQRVLWFAHHYLWDTVRTPSFGDDVHEAWKPLRRGQPTVRRGAGRGGRPLGAEPAYLIQDYQLALVPRFLRELRPQALIAHFSHTSFAGATYVRMLPTEIHDQLLRGCSARTCWGSTRR